jgi:PAS domain-containing protein
MAAEYRDDETRQHTRRVGIAAGLLAAELGLDAATAEIIEKIAPLHDLGKIGIPDAILLKPGRLDDGELAVMRTHAAIGAEILAGSQSPLLESAAEIALSHHERWDGSGYPQGLGGEDIPVSGRIVALVDAFDAMTHDRPYKQAMPIAEAVAEVRRCAGSHFDPRVVEAFERLDPDLIASPPIGDADRGLSESAWQILHEMTGIARDAGHVPSDAGLAATLAGTPIAALVADDARRCVSANPAALELLGLGLEQLRHLRIDDLAAPESGPALDELWADFMADGMITRRLDLVLPDSRRLKVSYRGVAHLLPGRHLTMLCPEEAARS